MSLMVPANRHECSDFTDICFMSMIVSAIGMIVCLIFAPGFGIPFALLTGGLILTTSFGFVNDDKYRSGEKKPKQSITVTDPVKELEQELGIYQLDRGDYHELVINLMTEMQWNVQKCIEFVAAHQGVDSKVVREAYARIQEIDQQSRWYQAQCEMEKNQKELETRKKALPHAYRPSCDCAECNKKYEKYVRGGMVVQAPKSSPTGWKWVGRDGDLDSDYYEAKIDEPYN